ncbi:5-methylthioadenosine/S-adenosylhomocysteine deaminase [Desulfobaculum xiamenense]|uniref:5-methylthioadenosine/S-adenosylhomocysteine deaminase n=1 Tax=Desulfobaculum xiamenense TaxID=995050 RepID=A0A846QND8_9BACT|nr:amidohydrolase [Desulfobaculum xiamenense]NJB66744.1 5-methylthioadenosine/S-adenosylhomocysteine deaminase [Desulfobaculum xiamenense]
MSRRACDTLIRADRIVTQNDERTIIEDGGIAIAAGRIAAVGPWMEIDAAWQGETVMNLGRSMVLPGLVNAHTHASMTLMRGLADDLPLMEWITQHIFPVEQKLTPELVRLGATLACCEMARTGTTAFYDMYLMEQAVAEAADATGMRAVVGEVIFSFPTPAYANLDAACDVVRAMHDTYRNNDRIRTAVMPHAVYTTTPELLTRTAKLAEELDIPLHIHLAETTTETAQCMEKFGKRPVAYLDSLGLLSPRTLAAHCVDLTDDEIRRLAETGTRVAHNPESNMKLASGIARVRDMADAGVVLGLGTDGACSNNNLDMFAEMSTCALLQKVATMDPTVAPAQQVLDMATRGGAACLNWPGIGSIEPGNLADITALDLDQPGLMPMYNPASHAVYAASGGDVRMTMVGGEVVYRDGAFPKVDYPALLAEVRSAAAWVRKQFEGNGK